MAAHTYRYARPGLTTDVVLLRAGQAGREVLLIRRRDRPFARWWALPGGFVEQGESAEQAAAREVVEEVGIRGIVLLQIGAFTDPKRHPGDWVVTVAFLAQLPLDARPEAGDDAVEARLFSVAELPALAFDHADIIEAALSIECRAPESS